MLEIVTVVVNNPKFIELQYKTLKHFVKGEYKFTVFNDAKSFPDFTNYGDTNLHNEIIELCKRLNIQCISIPNMNHIYNRDAAKRCADAHNFMLNYMLENNAKYFAIDSDMFLISEFNIKDLNNYTVAIVKQERGHIQYFWNGLYYLDTENIVNSKMLKWDCGMFEGEHCDVGGAMYKWMKVECDNNFNYKYYIKHLPSLTWNKFDLPSNISCIILNFCDKDIRNKNGKYFTEIYDNKWLHYRAGGNWRKEGKDVHRKLTNLLDKIIDDLINLFLI